MNSHNPIIAGLDLETTGLDLEKDHVVELSYVIMEVGTVRPLFASSELLYSPSLMGAAPLSPKITEINGITNGNLVAFGQVPSAVCADLVSNLKEYAVDYILAHNGEQFDKPMLMRICPQIADWHWIDTRAEIEYPDSMTSKRLGHLAADHGFVNPFPHTGLSDVLTMLRIASQYDFAKILERSKQPWITVAADVTFEQKDLAKARRYFWEKLDGKTYAKQWVKKIKAPDLEKEQVEAGFAVRQLA